MTCGHAFAAASLSETVALLERWTTEPAPYPRYFVCANPHSLEVARRDPAFDEAIRAADLVTPDGAGVVLASRILGGAIGERVCGPDLFVVLCERLNRSHPGTRMFFLGSDPDNLAALTGRFGRDFPALVVAGTLAPPYRAEFSPQENRAIIDAVNSARADILWIGLGAPKQEKWAHVHRDQLAVRVIGPIGGAFDWYTGRIKLPPRWMRRAGLQWLHRLCQEPRRLWRRNLDSPIFLARVLKQRWRGSVSDRPSAG
jgi:N-acetylglucosaminyldiphosphoundecaprenol N-acetyl-beta-D-mannosaminyltransferase